MPSTPSDPIVLTFTKATRRSSQAGMSTHFGFTQLAQLHDLQHALQSQGTLSTLSFSYRQHIAQAVFALKNPLSNGKDVRIVVSEVQKTQKGDLFRYAVQGYVDGTKNGAAYECSDVPVNNKAQRILPEEIMAYLRNRIESDEKLFMRPAAPVIPIGSNRKDHV